jgi:acylpyruvate hydrolase
MPAYAGMTIKGHSRASGNPRAVHTIANRSSTRETLQHPPLNFRLATRINAPYGDMWLPTKSEQFDYELEFSAVIGRRSRGITREQVPQVVVGYTIFNDGSVRNYQRQINNNLGKS